MIYDRAKLMYGQLRDVMGDSAFHAFLHDYYNRWALKHVDERAMRASAERAYGHALGVVLRSVGARNRACMDYSRRRRRHQDRRQRASRRPCASRGEASCDIRCRSAC